MMTDEVQVEERLGAGERNVLSAVGDLLENSGSRYQNRRAIEILFNMLSPDIQEVLKAMFGEVAFIVDDIPF